MGPQLHWVDTEAGEVTIVEVPKSSEVVSLKPKSGPEEFYVRRAARSDAIAGRELINCYHTRRASVSQGAIGADTAGTRCGRCHPAAEIMWHKLNVLAARSPAVINSGWWGYYEWWPAEKLTPPKAMIRSEPQHAPRPVSLDVQSLSSMMISKYGRSPVFTATSMPPLSA